MQNEQVGPQGPKGDTGEQGPAGRRAGTRRVKKGCWRYRAKRATQAWEPLPVELSGRCLSRLPAGYTEVEYIESSGCSFASGVHVTQHIKTVMDVSPLDSPTTETAYFVQAYLSAASTSNRIYYDTTWHTSGVRCRVGRGSVSHKAVSSNATPRRILLTMDYYNQIVSANDESVSTVNNLWITSDSGPKINLLGTSTAASTLHAAIFVPDF